MEHRIVLIDIATLLHVHCVMEVLILFIAALILNVTPFNLVDDPDSIHSCEVGDVIQNGRITCTCNQKYVYECIVKKPSKNHPNKPSDKKKACQPNKIYVQDTTTCICNYNGSWPHSACGDVFDSLPDKDVVKTKCQPDGYVFIGCNICRCNSKGYIDKTHCTNNDCYETVKSSDIRRSSKHNSVYGNCEARNWYSLAPCQFCFCLNENKLVCNTGNFNPKRLQLGTYNLTVCGKDLIKEAIELIPDENKLLRYGDRNSNSKTKPEPNSTPQLSVNDNIDINVNFENKLYRETESSNNYDKEERDTESDSESVEEKKDYDIKNEDKILKKSKDLTSVRNDDEEDDNTDNEVIDSGLKIPMKTIKVTNHRIPKKSKSDTFGEKFNIPKMISNVLKMAFRRSMLTINYSNCVPGSVTVIKCNSCFCLNNNKLLCSNVTCK